MGKNLGIKRGYLLLNILGGLFLRMNSKYELKLWINYVEHVFNLECHVSESLTLYRDIIQDSGLGLSQTIHSFPTPDHHYCRENLNQNNN